MDLQTKTTPKYNTGDSIYNHKISSNIVIDSILGTPQGQFQYLYRSDAGATGVATESDLGDPPASNDDVADVLFINMCSIQEILTVFPNLPGGKGVLARKIIKERNESPFDNELNFINRMLEFEPKCEWEEISHKLRFDKKDGISI